jgi:hypothetical protein
VTAPLLLSTRQQQHLIRPPPPLSIGFELQGMQQEQKKVSRNDGDVMFFASKIFLTQHSHGTAAAVKQTAAPPHPASPAAIDELRSAGNATRMVKNVSLLIEICYFLTSKMFSHPTPSQSLLLPTTQQLHPPESPRPFTIN